MKKKKLIDLAQKMIAQEVPEFTLNEAGLTRLSQYFKDNANQKSLEKQNIEIFKRKYTELKDTIQLKEKGLDASQRDLQEKENNIGQLQTQIEEMVILNSQHKSTIDDLSNTISELQGKMFALNYSVASQGTLEEKQKMIEELEEKVENLVRSLEKNNDLVKLNEDLNGNISSLKIASLKFEQEAENRKIDLSKMDGESKALIKQIDILQIECSKIPAFEKEKKKLLLLLRIL